MNDFIKLYSKDPEAAKAMYYREKVKFDVTQPSGKAQQKKMLQKYLEGL